MTSRLQEKFENEVLPALRKELGRENRMALPALEKIVINMGSGRRAAADLRPEAGRDSVPQGHRRIPPA
jgi:ribosomal protein L5